MNTAGSEAGPGSDQALPVQVQTRYERFPASLKGAFVMQGSDGNPHVVQIESAQVARIPGGPGKPFAVEAGIVDVAPSRDLFVPFEAPVSEIEPGWYVVESTVKVDGGRTFVFASRPFAVPWPRNDVRRGAIAVERTVQAGRGKVRIDRVEMGGDAAAVVWWPEEQSTDQPPSVGSHSPASESGGHVEAVLIADGRPLDVLPEQAGRAGRGDVRSRGEHRTLSYPVPRSTRSLAVGVRVGSGKLSEPVQLTLP
jgi:hypothetical protein